MDMNAIALLPPTWGVDRSKPSLKQNPQPAIKGSGCATKERPMYNGLLLEAMPTILRGEKYVSFIKKVDSGLESGEMGGT
jgi:hypothetical protein